MDGLCGSRISFDQVKSFRPFIMEWEMRRARAPTAIVSQYIILLCALLAACATEPRPQWCCFSICTHWTSAFMADGFIGQPELWPTLIQTNAANISESGRRDSIFYPWLRFLWEISSPKHQRAQHKCTTSYVVTRVQDGFFQKPFNFQF